MRRSGGAPAASSCRSISSRYRVGVDLRHDHGGRARCGRSGDVVGAPRRVEPVAPDRDLAMAVVAGAGRGDGVGPRRLLRVGGYRVLEVEDRARHTESSWPSRVHAHSTTACTARNGAGAANSRVPPTKGRASGRLRPAWPGNGAVRGRRRARVRVRERQRTSGRLRPAWPGNAIEAHLRTRTPRPARGRRRRAAWPTRRPRCTACRRHHPPSCRRA